MPAPTLSRKELASFIKSPKTIRDFENLDLSNDQLATNVNSIITAPLIGVGVSSPFTHDRYLAGSADIQLTDGGAKGALTLSLTTSGVSAATYGSAAHVVAFSVDSKGRITLAAQYPLTSANVTEVTNLYFTNARARAALSGSGGVSYNSGTGAISLANTAVAAGSFGGANKWASFTVDAQGRLTAAADGTLTIGGIAGATPAPDGTYASPTSITIVNGIVTAIS